MNHFLGVGVLSSFFLFLYADFFFPQICAQLQIKHAVTQAEIQLLKRKVRPLLSSSPQNAAAMFHSNRSRAMT